MSTFEKSSANVLDFAALKERRLNQRAREEYGDYLTSLADPQLESEVQFLLEEFSDQNFGSDYAQKVQLLLGELAQRTDSSFRQAIMKLGTQLGYDV